jgi:ectoine hydroxylase-related dioxygenase (phytanoyl-CoA dioxygenase family)
MMNLIKLNQIFTNDGVVLVKNFVSKKQLELVKSAINFSQKYPSPFSSKINNKNQDAAFFHDYWTYKRNNFLRELLSSKELIKSIETISGNKKVQFFHDHILIKNPSSPHTPWHHDRPYYFIDGPSNFSIWITPDEVKEDNSLAFCLGSHKSKNVYVPVHFNDTSSLSNDPNLKKLDDKAFAEESERGIVIYDMKPGDAIFFHNRTLHRSLSSSTKDIRTALSLRMVGDDSFLTKICCSNPQPPFDKFGMKLVENGEISEEWFPTLPL